MPTTTSAYVSRPSTGIALERVHYSDPGAHEILVETVAFSMCHTDVRAAAGSFYLKPPMVLGHEAAGYVKEAGPNVTGLKPGDAVVLSYAHCGACQRCLTGRAAYCDELATLNFTGERVGGGGEKVVKDEKGEGLNGFFFGQSSMGRMVLAHESCAVKVQASREELKLFSSLGCGIQTGAGAVFNVLKPAANATLAVFGGGAVGLAALLAAKHFSPRELVLVDNSEEKLGMIPKEITEGVTTINSKGMEQGKVAERLRELSPDGRGFDYVLDCVGSSSVITEAHDACAKCATLVTVGGSSVAKPDFALSSHLVKGVTYRGTHQGDSVSRVMVPYMIELWRRGRFPFEKLLTFFGFEELDRAMEEVKMGKVIKAVMVV